MQTSINYNKKSKNKFITIIMVIFTIATIGCIVLLLYIINKNIYKEIITGIIIYFIFYVVICGIIFLENEKPLKQKRISDENQQLQSHIFEKIEGLKINQDIKYIKQLLNNIVTLNEKILYGIDDNIIKKMLYKIKKNINNQHTAFLIKEITAIRKKNRDIKLLDEKLRIEQQIAQCRIDEAIQNNNY